MEPSDQAQPREPQTADRSDPHADPAREPGLRVRHKGYWIPTLLSAIRIPGAVVVLAFALAGLPVWFVIAYLVFAFTDWLDGRLAVWLDSRSVTGARLDTLGDVLLSAAMVLGATWLKWETIRPEIWLIGAVGGTYALSVAFALLRFGRWPIYHTFIAKWSWAFVVIAVIGLMADWSVWPLRIAAVVVSLGNLEAIAITAVLERPQANVWSLRQALNSRR